MVRKDTVDVIEIDEIAGLSEVVPAGVFTAERIFHIELVGTLVLPGEEGSEIGASGGHTIAMVKGNTVFEAEIVDSGSIYRAVSAAYIDQCGLHAFLYLLVAQWSRVCA